MDRANIETGHLEVFHETINAALCPAKDHRCLVHRDDARCEGNPLT